MKLHANTSTRCISARSAWTWIDAETITQADDGIHGGENGTLTAPSRYYKFRTFTALCLRAFLQLSGEICLNLLIPTRDARGSEGGGGGGGKGHTECTLTVGFFTYAIHNVARRGSSSKLSLKTVWPLTVRTTIQ